MCKALIVIDNEVVEVVDIKSDANNDSMYITLEDRRGYHVFSECEEASEAVRQYWGDMKDNNKEEFKCLIGIDRLVSWACDEGDGYGCSSFDDFLDMVKGNRGGFFAHKDGHEIEGIRCNNHFLEEVFGDTTVNKDWIVMYRTV